MALWVARGGDRRVCRASAHDAERRELSGRLDLLLWADAGGWELGGRLVQRDGAARGLALRAGHEAASWLALVTDWLDRGEGLPVVAVGERVGPPGVERAEATNLAARHVHTLRSRLRDPAAGFTPISVLSELVSIDTLLAFVIVSLGVLALRRREPDRPRPFRTPWVPVVPIASAVVSLGLMATLPGATWLRLIVWMAIGFALYFLYAARCTRRS